MTVKSNQERFSNKAELGAFSDFDFSSIMRFYDDIDERIPEYSTDSRKRDEFLYSFAFREPHLAGILNSVTAIDKNRGWRVVGGRNQVKRITEMLHNFELAPGISGWRPSLAAASSSFWATNMGSVVELGREGRHGPVRALYHVDPVRCYLTGKIDKPLRYYPGTGKTQAWSDDEFFRVVSLPNIRESMRGLGNCAVDRALQLGQLMRAVYRHDEEVMGSRAPRGLLMLTGIRESQWEKAMEARSAHLDNNEQKYFGSVAVLASATEHADAKLVALSELPKGFQLKEWTDMILYGYALCFGYDASEFYPVQYGALGRGNEVAIQHEKATGKGRLDFVLGFQEQLQGFLPDSITFSFDQRDEEGDLLHAKVQQSWVNVAKTMREAEMISFEESRALLAEYGIIPNSWAETGHDHETDLDDEVDYESPDVNTDGQSPEITDKPTGTNPDAASPTANAVQRMIIKTKRNQIMKEKLMDDGCVIRAAEKFPNEPIVQYSFPANTVTILWDTGSELLKKKMWRGVKDVTISKNTE